MTDIAPTYSVLIVPPKLLSVMFTIACVRLLVHLKVKPVAPSFKIARMDGI